MEKELSEKSTGIKELKNKLLVQEREIDDLKDTNRRLQRDLEQTKNDFTQMIKIMEDNETKLSLMEEREKTLKTKEQECKRAIEEAKLQRDEAAQKEKQSRKQITTMEQQWRQDAEERQKKYDTLLETVRTKHKAVLSQRDEEYSMLNEKLQRVQAEHDKVLKDFKVSDEEKNRATSALGEKQRALNEKCLTYDQQIRDIERKCLEEKRKLQSANEELTRDLEKTVEKVKESENQQKKIKQQLELTEKKAEEVENENREMKNTYNETSMERQSAFKEIERLKKINQTKLNELTDVYNMKVFYNC